MPRQNERLTSPSHLLPATTSTPQFQQQDQRPQWRRRCSCLFRPELRPAFDLEVRILPGPFLMSQLKPAKGAARTIHICCGLERPSTKTLTALFVLINFLCATQDIAAARQLQLFRFSLDEVDGWGAHHVAQGELQLPGHLQCLWANLWLCAWLHRLHGHLAWRSLLVVVRPWINSSCSRSPASCSSWALCFLGVTLLVALPEAALKERLSS